MRNLLEYTCVLPLPVPQIMLPPRLGPIHQASFVRPDFEKTTKGSALPFVNVHEKKERVGALT